jgi:hypothetical protein
MLRACYLPFGWCVLYTVQMYERNLRRSVRVIQFVLTAVCHVCNIIPVCIENKGRNASQNGTPVLIKCDS